MATAIDASTGLASDHVNVGFAVGKLAKDGYLFDNLRIRGNSISAESMEQEFIYDVFGRRVAKTTYDNYIAKTTYYAYDGDRVVEELDGNHNVVASYVYGGQYIDEVVEMWRDADGDEAIDPAERFYYLQDDMYNVVALADHAGDIVERYAYGDYGYPTVFDSSNIETGNQSAYGNPYLFNGRQWDADTGLYWYRTRYMDPELGRFISRDTIGLWGDENNLGNPYSYAGNNPWTYLDPYGLDSLEAEAFLGVFEGAGLALVGVGVGTYHMGVGAIGFYTGSDMYSTSDEEYNAMGEALYRFGTHPIQSTANWYENQVASAADALYRGDVRGLGNQIGGTAMQGLVLGETVVNPAANFAMGSSNATLARAGGLATTRVGSGLVARAATRMRVSGNLAQSRLANGASNFGQPVGAAKSFTHITATMESKILWGQRVESSKRVIGGHSGAISDIHPNYAVEVVSANANGTRIVKFVKGFPDGSVSRIKKSTLFPDHWSDSQIIHAVKEVGAMTPFKSQVSNRATVHRGFVNGIQVEVLKNGSTVISAYPTGL